jgi:tetrahydromethanopterin S-methyltransferase subunit G
MSTSVTRDDFNHLETRVSVVEQEVEGEKMVTRHILEQTRRNGDDLAAVKTRLGRLEQKLDGVDLKGLVTKVDGLDGKFDRLDRKVDDLTKSLPKIIGDVMRDVLRERDGER